MLFTLSFSHVETVVGVLRDGAVHHENTAQAAAHALQGRGDHGHEDATAQGSEHEHGPSHEHGTPADHCTHQHGKLSPVQAPNLGIVAFTTIQAFHQPSHWLDRLSEPFSPPPQA